MFAINLFESSETYKAYNITLHPEEAVLGCDGEKFRSAYWECYTRRHDPTSYHPHGTCRLGRLGDLNAVVDSKLRYNSL
jgi:choline dehydrogenase-like flavoprotein